MHGRLHPVATPAPAVKAWFEDFVLAHQSRLFGATYMITRDRAEAEDIVQEAFLRLFERWERVVEMDNPAGYLYRVSMNVFRSRRRRASMAVRRMARIVPPPDGLVGVEDRALVHRGMAELTPHQRAAIVATALYGLTSEEAAPLLGVKPTTVRARVSRARAALRDAIGDDR